MSRSTTKKSPSTPPRPPQSLSLPKSAVASRLRSQTRKQLGKHYRAKYGVR